MESLAVIMDNIYYNPPSYTTQLKRRLARLEVAKKQRVWQIAPIISLEAIDKEIEDIKLKLQMEEIK